MSRPTCVGLSTYGGAVKYAPKYGPTFEMAKKSATWLVSMETTAGSRRSIARLTGARLEVREGSGESTTSLSDARASARAA